jgi:hypothetical protein
MSERTPRRLLEGDANPFGRELLTAARSDRMSRHRSAAAIAAAIATTAPASALASADAGSGASAPAAPSAGLSLVTKLALGLAVAGGIALSVAYSERAPVSAPVARAPALATPQEIDTTAPGVPASPVQRAETTVSVHDLPAVPSAHASSTSRTRPTASAARDVEAPAPGSDPTIDSLDAELAALRRARGFLRSGDPVQALDELARYSARWPQGRLGPEADALAVDAELAAGRSDAARTRADAFLAKHGDSPLAPRVRRLRDQLESR